jgi:hypothetical protein
MVTRKWGYAPVGASGSPELYDLTVDPLAKDDLADQNGGIVREMHELFLAHLRDNDAPADALSCWGANPRQSVDGTWAIDYRS